MPKPPPAQKSLRQQLEENLVWTIVIIAIPLIVTTVGFTWAVAENVLLKMKDNEIAELNKQVAALTQQVNAARPTVTPAVTTAPVTRPAVKTADTVPPRDLPSAPPTPATSEDLDLSLEEVDERFKSLNADRSDERALVSVLANQRVRWRVRVRVVNYDALFIIFESSSGVKCPFVWSADFDTKFRKQLLRLSKDSMIMIQGILKPNPDGTGLSVQVETLEMDK